MIYLDNNATTRIDDHVLEEMLPYFKDNYGNASSITHKYGWLAKNGVEMAAERVCNLLNCDKKELVFTSGATESVNMAIKGVFDIYKRKGNHIITCKTEHKAVLDTCKILEKKGARVTCLDVDTDGNINLSDLRAAIGPDTILVALMYVNNETGLINPVREIAEIVHEHKSIFMSDATQAVGKIPIDLQKDHIDLMAFSAHKFHGPKGSGGLYIRRKRPRVILSPLIDGGGHQRGLRSGTLNVPGIIGLGAACEVAHSNMKKNEESIKALRNHLEKALVQLPNATIHSKDSTRLFNVSNIRFEGVRAEDIINAIKVKVAVATGSACTSENQLPSHVLSAMGLTDEEAHSSIRFSLSKYNTKEEIDEVIRLISNKVLKVLDSKV